VEEHALEGLAFFLAAAERVRQGDADQEGEAGLDGVMEAHAGPLDVRLVKAEELPDGVVGEGLRDLTEAHDFTHHEQHDEAAVCVNGDVALLLLLYGSDYGAH